MPDIVHDVAVASAFKLKIDRDNFGFWNTFEGLSWDASVETREEGGVNDMVHQLPGRLKYGNVKLSRPINSDSAKLASWFASLATQVTRSNAQIVAVDSEGKPIAQWGLLGCVPVKWTGPSFSIETQKAAMESIELAHHGFMDPAQAEGLQGG